MYTNIVIINILCIHIYNKCCTCVIINFSELFSKMYPSPSEYRTPINNGQNYGDQKCPIFRGFTVYIKMYHENVTKKKIIS
jgi:hypothetical protein